MDEYSSSQYEGLGAAVKRKRSHTLRRPRPETQWYPVSNDDGNGNANCKGKMFNLNQCISRGSSVSRVEIPFKSTKDEDGGFSMVYGSGDVGDDIDLGQGVPSRLSRSVGDGAGNENKLKKVKLKVGGVTRTIQTKSSSNGVSGGGSPTKPARTSDTSCDRMKSVHQGSFDVDNSSFADKNGCLESWREHSISGGNHGNEDLGKKPAKGAPEKLGDKLDPVRKSKRALKKRVLDEAFDNEDDDDEIRYLEKLKSSKASGYKESQEQLYKKKPSFSRSGKHEFVEGLGRSGKDFQKYRSGGGSEDTLYEEEEDLLSEGEIEGRKNRQKRDPSDSPAEVKREINLTTRQRALLFSKDASAGSQIEFPNGLPPPPPRKQKEKLSEVEQQLKRAEAAERRRFQNQKANEEEQAEAIRKILGQDSSRKKREEQKKKRMEELAQGKAANRVLGANTIRWVMGPTGTVVTFPDEVGLPQLFHPKPCIYPPPREKCAGPSCTNLYKYRDSKSQVPLCSLRCYKAIHDKQAEHT